MGGASVAVALAPAEPYRPSDSAAGMKKPFGLWLARGWVRASTADSPARPIQARP